MIRALLLDLDGTLVNHKEEISPRVRRAVAEASERMHVSIATGREPSHVIHYARLLGLTGPQIGDGGASVLDPATGAFIWSAALSNAVSKRIITDLEYADVRFRATYPGGSTTILGDLPYWDLTRISALGLDEVAADQLAAKLAASGCVEVNKSYLPNEDLWAVDFTPRGVNKGTAARRVAETLGVPASEIAAVGDSYNDIPLLEFCGFAVAMGGAPPDVAAVADHIAPAIEEDGAAIAIKQILRSKPVPRQTGP